jgi:peroxiredoxin
VPQCRAAIPSINALHAGRREKVQILGIDFRESREKVAATVKARDIRYTVLLDEKGKVARAYGVVGIPTFVLIDRNGVIAHRSHALPDDLSPWI